MVSNDSTVACWISGPFSLNLVEAADLGRFELDLVPSRYLRSLHGGCMYFP